jgi:ABC-2 type transport system ATP-binding protein
MPAVECSDLVVRYGATTAVDRVSFQVDRGEVVAILGPNGAGKTSTIETLEGYRIPDSGTVRVLDLDPRAGHRSLVPRIGVMPQRAGIYPMLGPRQVVELFAGYYPDPEPIDPLLDLVGLRAVERTPWRHLSGGEQQRLSLALALIGRPEAVFLDEPTAGVDPEGRIGLRAVITGLKDRGTCVLLTTHELAEAERLADRMVIMRAGRVLAQGTVEQLAATRGSAQIRFQSRSDLDTAALGLALGGAVTEGPGGTYAIDAAPSPHTTAVLATWLAEHDAELIGLRTAATLEETYLALVGADREQPVGAAPHPGRSTRARRRR